MSGTDISCLIAEKTGASGTIPNTKFPVLSVDDIDFEQGVLLKTEGDLVHIGYITRDEPMDYWSSFEEIGSFHRLERGDDPREMLKRLAEDDKLVLPVERYAHGQEHYSVAGTRNYPDRRWDVGLIGFYVPCDHVQNLYRERMAAGIKQDVAMASVVADANAVLSEYSKVVNGEVYGVVTETWRIEGDHLRAISAASVWAHIGENYAISSLREMLPIEEASLSL